MSTIRYIPDNQLIACIADAAGIRNIRFRLGENIDFLYGYGIRQNIRIVVNFVFQCQNSPRSQLLSIGIYIDRILDMRAGCLAFLFQEILFSNRNISFCRRRITIVFHKHSICKSGS